MDSGGKAKIYYASIVYRTPEAEHMRCLIQLLKLRPMAFETYYNDALITRARSIAASDFLRSDKDVLLMIDGDILFNAEQALQVCDQALTHDVVVGQYVTRNMGRCFPTSYQPIGTTIAYGIDTTPKPVDYGATGFMAIHRRVLEKLSKKLPLCHPTTLKFYPFFDTGVIKAGGEWIYASEDYMFCRKAKNAGFTVHVNPSVRLAHFGTHPFVLEDMARGLTKPQPMKLTLTDGNKWDIEMGGTRE